MSPLTFTAPDGRPCELRTRGHLDHPETCAACEAPGTIIVELRNPNGTADTVPICGRCLLAALAVRITAALPDADREFVVEELGRRQEHGPGPSNAAMRAPLG